ncbi:MAG TPA: hypothetical protein VK511_03655 [Gemmatimonadaceae bacterium]|nr:hypothetical protein [Gemmatimonadaceae bacterium]
MTTVIRRMLGSRLSNVRWSLGCVLAVAACGKGGDASLGHERSMTTTATKGAISMCALMPKEAVNDAIGTSYTIAEAHDEANSSSCHYSTEKDPSGLSLDMTWIQPSDYSNPAEHLALQKAGLSGAKLGGKLEVGTIPGADGGPMHLPSGPVEGVGDEATQNLLLLTARKGDYTLMVQIVADVMKLMTDSTAGRKVVAQERDIARAVFSKV